MKTTTEKIEKALLRKFHTLCSKLGVTEDEKRVMIRSFGCDSSRDLSAHDLMDLCDRLDGMLHPQLMEMDRWRKRLIASIGGWLAAMGRRKNDINTIRAIACRASQKRCFNDIPLEQLRSLYSAFLKKSRDMAMVEEMTTDELDILTLLN
jgi:hypothetical protein